MTEKYRDKCRFWQGDFHRQYTRLSAVARARAAGDAEAAAELNSFRALDLTDLTKLWTVFKWQAPFTGSDLNYITTIEEGALGPRTTPTSQAATNWYAAKFSFSLPKLWHSVIDFDATAAGSDLPIPFFVIQGRDDSRTPPDAARAFVDGVHAPGKGYTAIDGGHFACFANPLGFLNALDDDIGRLGIS